MESRGRRKTGCCWWFAVGTIGVFALLTATVLRPEPGLLDGATRVADARSWIPQFGGYFWESERSILTFRSYINGVRIVSVEIGSGAETERTALSADIRSGGATAADWRLSHAGRYLL